MGEAKDVEMIGPDVVGDITGSDGIARAHAFGLLLKTGAPVEVDELARSMHTDAAVLTGTLDRLARAGRIRRDSVGRLTGAAGLSVVRDRHQLMIESRTFWTWYAYDILGVIGALKADGRAWSRSPASGVPIELAFQRGTPEPSSIVLFRPDDSFAACCPNIYEEWCPNSNFLESTSAAQAWSEQRGVSGQIFTLEEAMAKATMEWAFVLQIAEKIPLQAGSLDVETNKQEEGG
jgi:hypothetical protein